MRSDVEARLLGTRNQFRYHWYYNTDGIALPLKGELLRSERGLSSLLRLLFESIFLNRHI